MDDKEYMRYINSIDEFLDSKNSSLFTLDNWVKCVKYSIERFNSDN